MPGALFNNATISMTNATAGALEEGQRFSPAVACVVMSIAVATNFIKSYTGFGGGILFVRCAILRTQ